MREFEIENKPECKSTKKEYPFLKLFSNTKPIIGMVHLKGYSESDVFERAVREINIYIENGVDGVMVEDYFGSVLQAEKVLNYIQKNLKDIIYGLNILSSNVIGFELAREYDAKFIQLDSVSGHLTPEHDKRFHEFILSEKEKTNAFILGGVRFKYQPYKSGRTLAEDLKIGMERCDAICVTGSGTGIKTDLKKIKSFRKIIGDYPMLVCAGLAAKNCTNQLQVADGGVVGSYFKDNHIDNGEVCQQHVLEFMNVVKKIRLEG